MWIPRADNYVAGYSMSFSRLHVVRMHGYRPIRPQPAVQTAHLDPVPTASGEHDPGAIPARQEGRPWSAKGWVWSGPDWFKSGFVRPRSGLVRRGVGMVRLGLRRIGGDKKTIAMPDLGIAIAVLVVDEDLKTYRLRAIIAQPSVSRIRLIGSGVGVSLSVKVV